MMKYFVMPLVILMIPVALLAVTFDVAKAMIEEKIAKE